MAKAARQDADAALAMDPAAHDMTAPNMTAHDTTAHDTTAPGAPAMAAQPTAPGAAASPPAGQAAAVAAARRIGATLAGFMVQPGGPQLAAVSLDGFDTHANEGASRGQLATRLSYLDAALDGLAQGLGPGWRDTAVVVVTEFGRTARVNGTGGTDHGTASTALVLGGGLQRGGIIGDWPTLADGRLFEDRDTAPTLDMRCLFKGLLAGQFGLGRAALDTVVFPGSFAATPADRLIA